MEAAEESSPGALGREEEERCFFLVGAAVAVPAPAAEAVAEGLAAVEGSAGAGAETGAKIKL